jgi:hypothetical protein
MSENYKIYKLIVGGVADTAARQWEEIRKVKSKHYAMHPHAAPVVDKLGFSDRVTVQDQDGNSYYSYPKTLRPPHQEMDHFYMLCPIGIKPDGTKGNFIPQDSLEANMGVSALVIGQGEVICERDPIKLPPPMPEPSSEPPAP